MANIAISGASGRMGLNLIKACLLNPSASLGAAIEHKDAASLGKDVGDIAGLDAQGLQVSADLQSQLPMLMYWLILHAPMHVYRNWLCAKLTIKPW